MRNGQIRSRSPIDDFCPCVYSSTPSSQAQQLLGMSVKLSLAPGSLSSQTGSCAGQFVQGFHIECVVFVHHVLAWLLYLGHWWRLLDCQRRQKEKRSIRIAHSSEWTSALQPILTTPTLPILASLPTSGHTQSLGSASDLDLHSKLGCQKKSPLTNGGYTPGIG